jgi:hypothetical protein
MKIRKSAGTPNGIELLLKRLTGLRIFIGKINLFSRKHKRKSPKTCIKEKYFLFLQQNKKKKDGKGNISLSVISHKSCNNS